MLLYKNNRKISHCQHSSEIFAEKTNSKVKASFIFARTARDMLHKDALIEVVHCSPSGGWVWFCCNVGPVSIFGYKALFAVLVVQWIWRFGKYLPLLLEAIFITTLKIFEYYCKLLEIVSCIVFWYDINFHFLSLLPFFTDLSAGLAKANHEGKYIYFLYNLLYI